MSDLVRQIEAIDGAPVDIEWAIAGGTVFLLQARPMTALPDVVSWDPGLPGAWLRGFRLGEWLGGPVTPLFESWGLTRIERAMDRTIGGLIGMDPPQPGHVVVNGWYYYGGLNLVPTSAVAGLGQLVRHIIPSFIVRPRKAVMAFPRLAGLGVRQAEREWRTEILPGYRALVERSRAEVETAEPSDLAALVDRLADAAGRYFGSVTQVAGYSSKAEVPLARFYGANLRPRIGGSHLDLLVALGQGPQGIAPHALRSLDWSEPTLGESGSAFDEGAARHRHEQAADRRRAAEAAARDALAIDAKLRTRFDRLLATAQHYALVREEQIGDFSLAWPVMQRAIARLAEDLVERGVLSDPDQVHFLEREEIDAAVGARRPSPRREVRGAAYDVAASVPPGGTAYARPPPSKMIARVVDEATEAIRGSLGDHRRRDRRDPRQPRTSDGAGQDHPWRRRVRSCPARRHPRLPRDGTSMDRPVRHGRRRRHRHGWGGSPCFDRRPRVRTTGRRRDRRCHVASPRRRSRRGRRIDRGRSLGRHMTAPWRRRTETVPAITRLESGPGN